MDIEQFRKRLSEEVKEAGTATAWSTSKGISPAYVSDVLTGRRDPGDKIVEALGMERVVMFVTKGSGRPVLATEIVQEIEAAGGRRDLQLAAVMRHAIERLSAT